LENALTERLAEWLSRRVKPNSSADIPDVSAAIATTVGEVRRNNEDRAVIVRHLPASPNQRGFILTALCDGMGGMESGARCAELAVAVFVAHLVNDPLVDPPAALEAATAAANAGLHREFRGRGGTTLVAALFQRESATGVSVGDSRLYFLSKEKRLKQISVDDTIAGELSRIKGGIAPSEGFEAFSTQLAQFVGMGESIAPRLYTLRYPEAGSCYILSSDGAHSSEPSVFESILAHAPAAQTAIGRLIHLSNWCGGNDNATLVCISPSTEPSVLKPSRNAGLVELWDSSGKLEILLPISESEKGSDPALPTKPPVAPRAPQPERIKQITRKRQPTGQARRRKRGAGTAGAHRTLEITPADTRETTTIPQPASDLPKSAPFEKSPEPAGAPPEGGEKCP